jgi:alkylation response protein AidB-like acyl-CoA dehydrogenase
MELNAESTLLLQAAQQLLPKIRNYLGELESQRRLPASLAQEMAEVGIFRMLIPRKLGGLEVAPLTFLTIIEDFAKVDGSVSWCAMIGATGGLISAYLPEPVAREIYGSDPHVITGGALAPNGKATVVQGGYRVTGRWPFNSGCQHCNWLMGNSVIFADDKPRLLANGQPDVQMLIFPAADADIIDTWRVAGLRGSGSHDIAVHDLFVPAGRAASFFMEQPYQTGPLYRFPIFGMLAASVATVGLGMARGAVDALLEVASSKTPVGSRRLLKERQVLQMHVAQAEGLLRAARAFLFQTIEEGWKAVTADRAVPEQQRAVLRLAATQATANAAQAIDLMYQAAGTSSIWESSPLQRHFRDVHVLTQHAVVAHPIYEMIGRVMLGLGPGQTPL